MPLKTFNDCLAAIRNGNENTLSEINARRNDTAQKTVDYNQHQYLQIVKEALNKFKNHPKLLDIVIKTIDGRYLPQDADKEPLFLALGIKVSSTSLPPTNNPNNKTYLHQLKDPLQNTGYFSDDEMLAVSYCFGFFNKTTLDNSFATKVLEHAIKGNQDEAEKLIKFNPACLLVRTQAVDYSGRTIIATPFQAALGAEDERMWQMMMPYFKVLERNGTIESSQQTMREQFDRQFPDGIDDTPANELLPIYNQLAQAIIDGNGEQAIGNFREVITQPGTIHHGKHFNMQHLIAAYQAYIDNFNDLATWPNRDMFWQKVIGYVQRCVPANVAQALCSGVQTVLDDPSKFKRTLKFYNGGDFFSGAVDSGLGFDFGCYSFYRVGARLSGPGVRFRRVAVWARGVGEIYVKQKQQSLQDLSNNLSQLSVINQCTIL